MYMIQDAATKEAVKTYIKLIRASHSVLACVEPMVAASGLTVTQLGVLEALLQKGAMTHRDLGRKVLTSAGNMTDIVDKLEARALVRRVRDHTDRRLVRVELTEAGRQLVEELFPRHAADIERAMSALGADELRSLGDLLRRVGLGAAAQLSTVHLEPEREPTT